MGRQEVPLDADAGAVQQFAAGLRELRVSAGQPTYRQLAKSGNYSAATLARAASGRSLPSLEVTLAYVTACGGDPAAWRLRWSETRRQHDKTLIRHPSASVLGTEPSASGPMSKTVETTETTWTPAEDTGSTQISRKYGRRLKHVVRAVAALSVLTNAALAYALISSPARSTAATTPPPARIEDGTDPKASHCDDARTLDAQPVILRQPTHIDGRQMIPGTTIGTVALRFSAHCAGAWTRFDPAVGLFTSPSQGTVTVQASRPAEGAQATWRLGHIDQTYSDLLLTGMGCVEARVVVNIFDGAATADGGTQCLPKM